MAYCTVDDMSRILPEKVKIGDQNIGTPVPGRSGNQGSQRSNISPEEAEYYIKYASSWLDGRLRPIYAAPLRRIKSYETETLSDVTTGTNVTVIVHDSGEFVRGDLVRLQNKDTMETSEVLETPTLTTVRLTTVTGTYLVSDNSKISILEFPDPIPLIAAQMAVSFVLDRLWTSEQSPDISKYGATQRNLARSQIENILSGEILLFGQEFTSRRFIRVTLLDAFSSTVDSQKGTEKE